MDFNNIVQILKTFIRVYADDRYLGEILTIVGNELVGQVKGPLDEGTRPGAVLGSALSGARGVVVAAVVLDAECATPDEVKGARRLYDVAGVLGIELRAVVILSVEGRRLIAIEPPPRPYRG